MAQSSMPVQVAGGYDWRQLSAGTEHVCGLTQAGLALCWGNGADGRRARSTLAGWPRPACPAKLHGFTRLLSELE